MRNSPFSFVKPPSLVPLMISDTTGSSSLVRLFLTVPVIVVFCARLNNAVEQSAIKMVSGRMNFLITAFLRYNSIELRTGGTNGNEFHFKGFATQNFLLLFFLIYIGYLYIRAMNPIT